MISVVRVAERASEPVAFNFCRFSQTRAKTMRQLGNGVWSAAVWHISYSMSVAGVGAPEYVDEIAAEVC